MRHTKLFMLAAAAMAALTGCSSTEQASEADTMRHDLAVQMMESRQFVIKANRLVLDKHSFPSINSATNFIKVDGDEGTVQVSPANGGGPNGVGGFTVKGNISGYEVKMRSNGEVTVKYNITASPGSCSVYINLPKDTDYAVATINSTFRGKNATIHGTVADIDHSIFVGKTH